MKRNSTTRQFAKTGAWTVIAGSLLTALSLPTWGQSGPAPKARPSQLSASADPGAESSPNSSEAASPAAPASGVSLEQVLELLQAQGRELDEVRAELREQQQLTARLEAKLNAANGTTEVAESVAAAAAPVPAPSPAEAVLEQKVAKLQVDLGNSKQDLEKRLKVLGPFVFSGDFRLRAEPTFGGPVDKSQDQFRERFRLRFNGDAILNDQLKGGFSFASGDLNNPISTNQTSGQYTTRKPIEIDRAYATYNPEWLRPLTVTGGKFAYPWFNTELVWDKDLNPEGAAETLTFNTKTSTLKKFSLVGFQMPVAETKRTATTNKSVYSTMVYGEQLQTFWQLGSRVKLSAYTSFYDWKNADAIAYSVAAVNGSGPDSGLLQLNSNGSQNSTATVTATNSVTGAKTITSAQLASKFGILDSLAQIDIKTPYDHWPISLVGDIAQNTRACENVRNILAGAVYSAPCDPHARRAYWLEGNIGKTVKRGDWQFSYTRIFVEREAVVGAFNYSEIFPSTNVEMHRPEVLYQLFDNVTLQLNGLFGRPLVNAGSPAPVQPLWERLQFDMTYKF